jgi:CDP-4-dehydro-6-deoxyglucose reductase, E3
MRVVAAGARVAEVSRPSADVAVLRLQLPATSGFRFKPGQYLDIVLRDGARRSYSMANVPDETGVVELHVRRIPGGRFSEHAYDKLKARDMLRVEGPFGIFTLNTSEAPIVFLASGTGYAPIASMLAAHKQEIGQRGARLYWGGRKSSDLYGLDDLLAWHNDHPGVELIPVLSEPGDGWTGRTGFVHDAVLADHESLAGHEVYACGNPLMIKAAQTSFCAERGLSELAFFSDAFIAK